MKQGLTEASFVVGLIRDGLDGMHMALSEPYDLVILDVMLPTLDGWRVLQNIRKARALGGRGIILLQGILQIPRKYGQPRPPSRRTGPGRRPAIHSTSRTMSAKKSCLRLS